MSKSTKKPAKKLEEKKSKSTPLEFKLAAVFAGLALVSNLVIYFYSVLPTYDVINESTKDLSDTLESSEKITNIFTPIIIVCLVLAVVLIGLGLYKNGRNKSKK